MMGLTADLESEVEAIFKESWTEKEGQVVPAPENLSLSNEARHFERGTVLYADLSGSTKLVNKMNWGFAGEIYKSYLVCAAKLIRSLDGVITAYDGDRVMAVFLGDLQTTNAATCGLRINWAVQNIVNPALKKQYTSAEYVVKQVVGVDTSELRAARIGVRGGNDLVWIGRAANYAAKLTECRNDYPTFITEEAYNKLAKSAKFGGSENKDMWTKFKWNQMGDIPVYGSNWSWKVD
jgi:class 3 adenylate cyclase